MPWHGWILLGLGYCWSLVPPARSHQVARSCAGDTTAGETWHLPSVALGVKERDGKQSSGILRLVNICEWSPWGAVGAQRRGPTNTGGWEGFLEEVMSEMNPGTISQVMS